MKLGGAGLINQGVYL